MRLSSDISCKQALRPGAPVTCALRARLRDTRGFTLAEQLVSVLFLGLLVVVIGVGLNAALGSYRLANETTRANELLARAVEEVSDELAFAPSVAGSGEDCAFVSPTTKTPVKLANDPDGKGIALVLQEPARSADAGAGSNPQGSAAGSSPSVLIVASSHGLTVEIFGVAFSGNQEDNDHQTNDEQSTWSYRIEVKQEGSATVIAQTDMTVAWIG